MINIDKVVFGYNAKKYTLSQLRELCPSYSEIKQQIKNEKLTHAKKKEFSNIYNSEALLENETWVRLSQKGFNNIFVSNYARVRYLKPDGTTVFLKQDEDPTEANYIGYLVIDPLNEFPELHKLNRRKYLRTYTLVAMAFLGKQKYEYDGIHVHHIDNNGYDCKPENLILLDRDSHLNYVHHN